MTIFNIKRIGKRFTREPQEPPGAIFGTSIIAFAAIAALSAIVIAFLIFFIMPRGAIGFFERKTANTIRMTGFSGNVDLGEIGAVKTDSTIVMRVEIKGAAKRALEIQRHVFRAVRRTRLEEKVKGKDASRQGT